MCDNNVDLILKYKKASLWLGNRNAALDLDFLKKANISLVINCTENLPFIYDVSDEFMTLESIRIPINDTSSDKDNMKMKDGLIKILPIIHDKFINKQKNILIHCYAGVSRSASVMAATLFYIFKKDKNLNITNDKELLNNIIQFIINRRSCTFYYGTKLNFRNSLVKTFNIK